MEDTIFNDILTRLKSDTATAHFAAQSQPVPVEFAWYEQQPENAIEGEKVITYTFDMPAVFVHFSEPTQLEATGNKKIATGKVTLHIVQDKIGQDSGDGMETHADFKTLLEYLPCFVALLDGYTLSCGMRLQLESELRDHINRPILWEQITFSFSGRYVKQAVTEV